MPDFCTCGAQLPPDALFCHKCGKPQRTILEVEPEPPPPVEFAPAPPPLKEAAPMNFQNPVALRVALMVAAGATILSFVIPFLNWIAGGFFAVLFYRRRTGSLMNVNAGVRLGWITGIAAFVFSAIVFSIQVVPHLSNLIQQQIQSLKGDPATVQQMARFFQTGPGIATALTFILGAMFVMITLLTMAGGALGAKMMGRN